MGFRKYFSRDNNPPLSNGNAWQCLLVVPAGNYDRSMDELEEIPEVVEEMRRKTVDEYGRISVGQEHSGKTVRVIETPNGKIIVTIGVSE